MKMPISQSLKITTEEQMDFIRQRGITYGRPGNGFALSCFDELAIKNAEEYKKGKHPKKKGGRQRWPSLTL